MAYFAKLGADNIVIEVHPVHNDTATSEQVGIDFLNNLFGTNDVWKQTFKDGSQRKNYAGKGHIYDEARDAFYIPQPYPSWILNETTCTWEAPKPYPDPTKHYIWNEDTISWDIDPNIPDPQIPPA